MTALWREVGLVACRQFARPAARSVGSTRPKRRTVGLRVGRIDRSNSGSISVGVVGPTLRKKTPSSKEPVREL